MDADKGKYLTAAIALVSLYIAAQIIAIMGDEVQLMDMKTYETFNLPIDDEFADKLAPGGEILYVEAMGRRKITRA